MLLSPPSEPPADELRFLAYDADGKPITVGSYLNMAVIHIWNMPKIATFEVQWRPYTYLEFDGIHYDPDPKLWKNVVWGSDQASEKIEVGGVTAELQALASTSPNDPNSNQFSQVPHPVRTVEGQIWKDHPKEFDIFGPVKYGTANPTEEARSIPNSWVGFVEDTVLRGRRR